MTLSREDKDTLRQENDFSGGVSGKHHEAYSQGTNGVLFGAGRGRGFQGPRRSEPGVGVNDAPLSGSNEIQLLADDVADGVRNALRSGGNEIIVPGCS